MRNIVFSLLFLPLFAYEHSSMLQEAEKISQQYAIGLSKLPPPNYSPDPDGSLNTAANWITIDLNRIVPDALSTLNDEKFWDLIREIGMEGAFFKDLKEGGEYRTGFGIDPKWGEGFESISSILEKKGIVSIGKGIGIATGISEDFFFALKNVPSYLGIYQLIEIEKQDWPLLPQIPPCQWTANVPWLKLQALAAKGYVPEQKDPYTKQSAWNTTKAVVGVDGKERRWIYLKTGSMNPVIDYLFPSMGGFQIALGDLVASKYLFREKLIQFEDTTSVTKEMLALWARKLNTYSILIPKQGLHSIQTSITDLCIDSFTPKALLHALITEDAEALRCIYRILLKENVPLKRLVHTLQPFDQFSCNWGDFLQGTNQKIEYYDEILTQDALDKRLFAKDLNTMLDPTPITWPAICLHHLDNQKGQTNVALLQKAHLLLALFYAMQPGTFSLSLSDLLGSLSTKEKLDPMAPNENILYGSLPSQMMNQCSFAQLLRKLLEKRGDTDIAHSKLKAVLPTKYPGLLLLFFEHPNNKVKQLLAINFGKEPALEKLNLPSIQNTTAIDVLRGLFEKKALHSPFFQIYVPPLSGKVIRFQPKYID